MTITLNSYDRQKFPATFQDKHDISQSTATSRTTVNIYADVFTMAGGTASGFSRNIVLLPTTGAVEGQVMWAVHLATGETIVQFTGTATGAHVYNVANQWGQYKYMNESWKFIAGGATLATATS
jgi:hypothetical protein